MGAKTEVETQARGGPLSRQTHVMGVEKCSTLPVTADLNMPDSVIKKGRAKRFGSLREIRKSIGYR